MDVPVTRSKAKGNNPALVQEILKDIVTDKGFLSLIETSVEKRLADLQMEVDTQKSDILELQVSNDKKTEDIVNLKDRLKFQEYRVQKLSNSLDAQEQYSRRNCLRLFGCPEQQGENTDDVILAVASNSLKVNVQREDIERSHRVGAKRHKQDGTTIPRGIIIKFRSYMKRREVLASRRNLKGTKMILVEDLTTKNQELLKHTREHKKIASAWSTDGRIIALMKGKDKVTKVIHDCVLPDDIDPNLIVDPVQDSYFNYQPITVSCPPGYNLSPSTTTYYCNPTGDNWDYDPGDARCEAATVPCSKPNVTDPDIVFTPDKTSYDTDETVTASCSIGTLHGDDVGLCLDDGTWEFSSEPSCKSDCLSPPNTNDTTGSYPHAETVTFFCREGFELAGGGNSNELTCDDGSWDLEFNCEAAGCPLPSVPTDVEIEDPEGELYEVHSSVVLKCIGDRTLSGPGFSYCNETSQWDPDPMTIKCRDQCLTPSFDDSRIIHTSHLTENSGQSFYDHTDTIRFSCEDGIFVDGPWKSACKDGVWSPRIGGYRPVCKKNCTVPENMSNEGAVFQHSKRHTFTCNDTPGMVRMGGPLSVCSDGVWTPRIRCALKRDLRSEL